MTKKDYKLIAEVLKTAIKGQEEGTAGYTAMEAVITDMADKLASHNTRFDMDKFLTACGITE